MAQFSHTGCGYTVTAGAVNFTGALNSAIIFRDNTLIDGKGLTVSGRSTRVLGALTATYSLEERNIIIFWRTLTPFQDQGEFYWRRF